MKLNIGDYIIETDERQFKVREIVGKDKDGKDIIKTIAYCTSLQGALTFIPQQVIRSNEDINTILNKLDEIQKVIESI